MKNCVYSTKPRWMSRQTYCDDVWVLCQQYTASYTNTTDTQLGTRMERKYIDWNWIKKTCRYFQLLPAAANFHDATSIRPQHVFLFLSMPISYSYNFHCLCCKKYRDSVWISFFVNKQNVQRYAHFPSPQ